MKYLIMFLLMFSVSCGIVPDGETYVFDESVRSNDNTTAAIERYMSFRGR